MGKSTNCTSAHTVSAGNRNGDEGEKGISRIMKCLPLPRPPARSQRKLQSQLLRRSMLPVFPAEGTPSNYRSAHRFQLRLRLQFVDQLHPVPWPRYRPPRQFHRLLNALQLQRLSQASPSPLFGTRHEVRTPGVPLHIAAHGVEMLVLLHRKRLG